MPIPPLLNPLSPNNPLNFSYIGAARVRPSQVERLKREEAAHGAKTRGVQDMQEELPERFRRKECWRKRLGRALGFGSGGDGKGERGGVDGRGGGDGGIGGNGRKAGQGGIGIRDGSGNGSGDGCVGDGKLPEFVS